MPSNRRPPQRRSPHRQTREAYDASRSARTRARILEAAFDTLLELGLSRATTVEIGRRAKAPRGTLLHHFPTREALIVGALAHVFEKRNEEFHAEVSRMEGVTDPVLLVERGIDLLWNVIRRGHTTIVWLELLIGARTDAVLNRELTRVMRAFDERFDALFSALMSPATDEAELRRHGVSRRFAFAVLNGLALDRIAGMDDHAEEVVAELKRIATSTMLEWFGGRDG
jgi:AcrR family transcriptional regulator